MTATLFKHPHQFASVGLITQDLLDEAVQQAAQLYGVAKADILGPSRKKPIAHARQYAMWLLRHQRTSSGRPRFSFPEIAYALNRKDHTTAIHAVRAVDARFAAAAQGRAA